MSMRFFLCGDSCHPIKRRSYFFQLGPLHYRVVYYCSELDRRSFAYVELILESVDPELQDPNLDYDRLKEMESRRYQTGTFYSGYGVAKNTFYALKTLATLAAILRDIVKDENPDEFRCLFTDTSHSSCWKKFFYYIARPTSAIREITVEPSRFHRGGEEWVISLK